MSHAFNVEMRMETLVYVAPPGLEAAKLYRVKDLGFTCTKGAWRLPASAVGVAPLCKLSVAVNDIVTRRCGKGVPFSL